MNKKLTTEEFIRRAMAIHGNKYDYSEIKKYENNHTKVPIICPIHDIFWQVPMSHLRGIGCPKCHGEERGLITRKPFSKFVKEADIIHLGKYSYVESTYKNSMSKLCIICPKHGEFWQTPHDHLRGCGCPKCYTHNKFDLEEFIKRSKEIHGDKYDYSKAIYIDYYTRLCLICPIHGDFWITPSNHLSGAKRGCPLCNKSISKLEEIIKDLLITEKINYIAQHRFEWLGYQSLDFYLPDYNIAIECQGKQHFGLGGWSKSFDFKNLRKLDEKKYNLCKENNVKLLYFSNIAPKSDYLDKVYTDKNELLKTIRYLYNK